MALVACGHIYLLYLFLIICILPTTFGASTNGNQYIFDQIGAAILHVCYLLFCDISCSGQLPVCSTQEEELKGI